MSAGVGVAPPDAPGAIAELVALARRRAGQHHPDSPGTVGELIAQIRRDRLASMRSKLLARPGARPHDPLPVTGITMQRITNPTPVNTRIVPPLKQVLVQDRLPLPNQLMNVVFVTVRNSTGEAYDASDGFAVRLTNQTPGHSYPVLTGDETWEPGEVIVFYILTKEYYPLRPIQSAGFAFNFVNPRVVAIPGPSGFFQRVPFIPERFPRVLDAIVVAGPGSKGRELGLPDTSLWELIPASLDVIPL